MYRRLEPRPEVLPALLSGHGDLADGDVRAVGAGGSFIRTGTLAHGHSLPTDIEQRPIGLSMPCRRGAPADRRP